MDIYECFKQDNMCHDGDILINEDSYIPIPQGVDFEQYSQQTLAVQAGYWFKHRASIIADAIAFHSKIGKYFVDIGGGTGTVLLRLIENGYKPDNVVLVEPQQLRARFANNRGIKKVICGFFNNNTVKPDSVPAVGLFDVLEHIEDDCAFLKEIRDFIKPSGELYITVPAYNWLWSKKDGSAHKRRYNLKQLKSVAEAAGFRVEYATYFFSLLVIPIFILRAIPYKLKRSKPLQSNIQAQTKSQKSINENYIKEHTGRLGSLVSPFLKTENYFIKTNKKIPFGASCLIIARKVTIPQGKSIDDF